MNTFNRIKALVIAQGIISRIAILPDTDLTLDLNYNPADIAELFRMVQSRFNVTVPPEEYSQFTRLSQIVDYVQANHQLSGPG